MKPVPVTRDTELSGQWRIEPLPADFDISSIDAPALVDKMITSDSRIPRFLSEAGSVSLWIGELQTSEKPDGAGVFLYLRIADGPTCLQNFPAPRDGNMSTVQPIWSPCNVGILQPATEPTRGGYTFEGVR